MEQTGPTLFQRLGGESTIRSLVDHFYDLMDSLPEVSGIREMHDADLTEAREKLFEFLCGCS